jgi:hypothetical protein
MEDDKLKLKTIYDNKLLEGQSKFLEYVKQDRIKEWVDKFMPFIDDNTRESIHKCYKEMYNNDKK